MATECTLQMQERISRCRKNCRTLTLGSNRGIRAWIPRKGFQACLASKAAPGPLNARQIRVAVNTAEHGVSGGSCGSCSRVPLHRLRRVATCAAAAASGGVAPGASSGSIDSDWKWHEPILDGSLSNADRAVLALARAAANLSDKILADKVAAAHHLAPVTNSEVCVGPLLPPFGSTLEDDGEEGDGMAPPPPPSFREAVRREPRQAGSGGGRTPGVGGTASSWLSAVFPSSASAPSTSAASATGAVRGSRTAPPGAAEAAAAVFSPSSPTSTLRAKVAAPAAGARRAAPPDVQLRDLALVVAEGGGGDENEGEDEDVLQAFANRTSGGVAVSGGREGAGGMMGAAAAALTRVARAAATSADVPSAAPLGRAAAGAASAAAHAAQAAVATAVKATAQMLPNYGEPSSSWLVADDPTGCVRYIVVAAGADLRRRTPRELTTELVTFETYNLGAKVNKRLYGEASALYARFMPLVMDYLEAVPHGSICFGGQGVGGALAVLLQLMCVHRGLRFARLLPAVAVDAPAVLAQVPREQRRMWGPVGREQQRPLSQDSVEDLLEDLMQRSVLEELGLPQDAVRNLVLPPPPSMSAMRPSASPPRPSLSSLPLISAWHSAGQQQAQQQSDTMGAAAGPVLVLGTAAAATVGDGGNGGGPATTAGPACPQVFRLVGKVVHVETIGSWSNRTALTPATGAVAATALAADAVLETDGGSGELTVAAAAAAAPAPSSAGGHGSGGFGVTSKRLDVAMVGSIATAAASAAASAVVERLRHVSTGALRSVKAADRGGRAVAAAAAPLAATSAAAAAGAEDEDEDDSYVYGV